MDGKRVRMLYNINAIALFSSYSKKEPQDMAGNKDVTVFRQLAYACAIEGEAADGRDLGMNEIEFGRLVSVENMNQFKDILESQGVSGGLNKSTKGSPWWRSDKAKTGMAIERKKYPGQF